MPSSAPAPPVRRSNVGRVEALVGFLREEANGGKLLLVATGLALLWTNLSLDSYQAVWRRRSCWAPIG